MYNITAKKKEKSQDSNRALHRREHLLLVGCGVTFAFVGWLFFALLEDVMGNDPIVVFDKSVHDALINSRTPLGNHIMVAITEMGDTAVILSVAAIVCLWFLFERHWRTAFYWAASIGFASALNSAIKFAVHRPRPSDLFYTGVSEYSFPSGHTTTNAVMYGFFGFLIARQLRVGARVWVTLVASLMIIFMALSRLYLGAHWFSDVLASLSLASAWLIVICVSYRRHGDVINLSKLCIVAGVTLLMFGGANIIIHHQVDFGRYKLESRIWDTWRNWSVALVSV